MVVFGLVGHQSAEEVILLGVMPSLCLQPRQDCVGSWPWCGPGEDGLAEARFRYSLTTLTVPRRCFGMARRRVGRGGRWGKD